MRRVDEIGDSFRFENMHEKFLKVIDQSLLAFEGFMVLPVVGKLIEIHQVGVLAKLGYNFNDIAILIGVLDLGIEVGQQLPLPSELVQPNEVLFNLVDPF